MNDDEIQKKAIWFESNDTEVRLTMNRTLLIMAVVNLILIGMIFGFMIGSRIVENNWREYFDTYEKDCPCNNKDLIGFGWSNLNTSLFEL